jgi:NAD(P)H dehydrogenase (quinone)
MILIKAGAAIRASTSGRGAFAMKHSVIVAHPRPESLTCAIAEAYAEAVRKAGDAADVRDLYRMGFDPRLKESEIPGESGAVFGADVAAERARLADADVFAFVYPLWFNAPPAMLKGYVDRVFSLGFGYEPGPGGTEPLLQGRRLISFTTSGAPESWVRDTGAFQALTTLFDAHVAAVCGMTVLDHVHNGGIAPGLSRDAAAEILDNVRAAAGRAVAQCRQASVVLS